MRRTFSANSMGTPRSLNGEAFREAVEHPVQAVVEAVLGRLAVQRDELAEHRELAALEQVADVRLLRLLAEAAADALRPVLLRARRQLAQREADHVVVDREHDAGAGLAQR